MYGYRGARVFAIGCIILLIASSTSLVNAADVRSSHVPRDTYAGLQSLLFLSWDANATSKPIMPQGELRSIKIIVSFVEGGGFLAPLFAYLMRGRQVEVHLQITQKPDWCTASLSSMTMAFSITSHLGTRSTYSTILSMAVSDKAPAYQLGSIGLRAQMDSLYGNFGLLRYMMGTTFETNMTIIPGYKGLLGVLLPEGNTFEAPPLATVNIPINVTNLGNGRTEVITNLSNPQNWSIDLPYSFDVNVGQTNQCIVQVITPTNFSGDYVFYIGFTPHFAENMSQGGNTIYLGFLIQCNSP